MTRRTITPTNTGFFPEGVLVDILARLPLTSLLRAKSVCKLWYQMISEKYLIQLHCGLSSNPVVLLQFHNSEWKSTAIIVDSSKYTFDLLLNCSSGVFHVKSSCNGVLCLVHGDDTSSGVYSLCNPITREGKWIPELKERLPVMMLCSDFHGSFKPIVGMTYDSISLRFKVVVAGFDKVDWDEIHRSTRMFVCFVFDSFYGFWRKFESMQEIEWKSVGRPTVVFVNGRCHWLIGDYLIYSFDLEFGFWGKISFPDDIHLGPIFRLHLMECNSCLLVIHVTSTWINIWELYDYWNEKWRLVNKLSVQCLINMLSERFSISFPKMEQFSPLISSKQFVFPICLTPQHLIVQFCKHLCLYNWSLGVWEHLYAIRQPYRHKAHSFCLTMGALN